jgi:L,D-peptidoglycan transpeptidase YkuD (ErfK/YbiS/YcfS/YnhG family)
MRRSPASLVWGYSGPMHRLRPSLLLAALVVATGTRADPPAAPATPPATTTAGLVDSDVASVLAASRQLVVVQTSSWDDRVGRLQRFERHGTDKGGGWRAVGEGIDIVVGTAGLGWGIGLHGGGVGVNAPRKVEGDGRAPAGVFRLTRAFGKQAAPESGLPSRTLTPGDVCVDDVSHAAYNRILPAGTEKTWKSAEQLVRKDWLYDLIVVVDQNHGEGDGDRVVAGRGSCVFLHVWRREKSGTAGCTAMDKAHLEDVIRWLKADDAPLLVQLPRDVYASVRATWGLP